MPRRPVSKTPALTFNPDADILLRKIMSYSTLLTVVLDEQLDKPADDRDSMSSVADDTNHVLIREAVGNLVQDIGKIAEQAVDIFEGQHRANYEAAKKAAAKSGVVQ